MTATINATRAQQAARVELAQAAYRGALAGSCGDVDAALKAFNDALAISDVLAGPVTAEHDVRCEILPGGEYHGKTIGGGGGYEPMQIPCHCPARADGRRQAEREIRRAAR